MIDFKKIEKQIFKHKDQHAYAPEAIDGGYSKRPVSGWEVRKGYHNDEDEWIEDGYKLSWIDVFSCYDGWDYMDEVVGYFDTYEGAVMGAYATDIKNETITGV